MAGFFHFGIRVLLLSFIKTGVDGDDGLFSETGYDITFPCEDGQVCFHLWRFSTSQSEYIAIISNGKIQEAESEEQMCTLRMKDLAEEDVGRLHCQRRTKGTSSFETLLAAPGLKLMPAKTISLQCVLLTFGDKGHCQTLLHPWVRLAWVDDTGAEIQEDSQHQINEYSPCETTLTVTLQTPEIKKFTCRATVDNQQVLTSVEFWVRAPALKGKGRGLVEDLEPDNQGGSQDTIGAAVGVACGVVLTAAVAVFVVRRTRRGTNRQRLDEPRSVQPTTCNVINTDDVVYADIVHPVGSDRVWATECEPTEYACVRYK